MNESQAGKYNAGILNPHQLGQLLTVLSDDSVDHTALDALQKRLNRSFIAGDSMKVKTQNQFPSKYDFIFILGGVSFGTNAGRSGVVIQSKSKTGRISLTLRFSRLQT